MCRTDVWQYDLKYREICLVFLEFAMKKMVPFVLMLKMALSPTTGLSVIASPKQTLTNVRDIGFTLIH